MPAGRGALSSCGPRSGAGEHPFLEQRRLPRRLHRRTRGIAGTCLQPPLNVKNRPPRPAWTMQTLSPAAETRDARLYVTYEPALARSNGGHLCAGPHCKEEQGGGAKARFRGDLPELSRNLDVLSPFYITEISDTSMRPGPVPHVRTCHRKLRERSHRL